MEIIRSSFFYQQIKRINFVATKIDRIENVYVQGHACNLSNDFCYVYYMYMW